MLDVAVNPRTVAYCHTTIPEPPPMTVMITLRKRGPPVLIRIDWYFEKIAA